MSGGNTERQIVLIKDFGARTLCATPSYALNIAEVAEREGVDLRGGELRFGIFGAEPWTISCSKSSTRTAASACRWGKPANWSSPP